MFGINTTQIKVGGMMCEHCVSTVKKALEELPDVKGVTVVLKTGEVTVKHRGEFPLEATKKALEEAEYSFQGIIG